MPISQPMPLAIQASTCHIDRLSRTEKPATNDASFSIARRRLRAKPLLILTYSQALT